MSDVNLSNSQRRFHDFLNQHGHVASVTATPHFVRIEGHAKVGHIVVEWQRDRFDGATIGGVKFGSVRAVRNAIEAVEREGE